ncbi:MAG: oligosaccharide flippase family protein [Candidatus Omnitrophota bacterium]
MSKTKKFFKDVVFYSGSNLLANIMNFITAIVVRKILQPALMGLYNEIMLIFDYAQYSHLGIINSLDKELPYLYGKKDYGQVERVRNIGFTVCLMVVASISAGILIASFFVRSADMLLLNGIRIVSILIVARLIGSLYVVLNRSKHEFAVISKYTMLVAALDLVLKVVLILKFGLYGLLWASVITALAGLIYFYAASGERFSFLFDFAVRDIARLLKIGFPIFLTGFVFMTLTNIDRIMILRLLDTEKLGLYTIGLMVNVYIVQLPNLVYAVIFPRFYQAYGERQNIFEIKDLFVKPTLVFAYLFPVLIGGVILILPLLVHYILPAYAPGLFPAYLLLLGSFFLALVNMPGYLLVVLDKQFRMVMISGACVALSIFFIYIAVRRFNLGLAGVAIGASLAYLSYTSALISYAFTHYTKKVSEHVRFLAELYMPLVWVIAMLFIVRAFRTDVSGRIGADLISMFGKSAVFLIGCIPLALFANKKTGIITLLRSTYMKKT